MIYVVKPLLYSCLLFFDHVFRRINCDSIETA